MLKFLDVLCEEITKSLNIQEIIYKLNFTFLYGWAKITMIESILTGIFSSLVASALFLFCLVKLRPKIEISPYISLIVEDNGKKVYRFKIINRTRRPIINVQCRLLLTISRNVPDGMMLRSKRIKLHVEHVFQIPKYDKKDKEARYARRFICYKDIDSLWEDQEGKYLRFVILATDSFSGFSKVFYKEFLSKKDCLIEGDHRFGDSLEISRLTNLILPEKGV